MTSTTQANITRKIKAYAEQLGFDKCGVCSAHSAHQAGLDKKLTAFLNAGYHGNMDWLAKRTAWRADPTVLWPDVQSIIMLAVLYTPQNNPMEVLAQHDRGVISTYAHYNSGRDYHVAIKKNLKKLGRFIIAIGGGDIKVFVDTAAVMEKPLAALAGLGWQGKHTNLLARDLGNWFFLGAIFTTVPLVADTPSKPHCGNCRACLDICPTGAFPAPFQLDARRCISYLTIEHKGAIDADLRPLLGNRIYGCDDCLAVCPWNKFARAGRGLQNTVTGHTGTAPHLSDLAALDENGFRVRFAGSPIKRIGWARFIRNVLYAIGNSGNKQLIQAAQAHCNAPNAVVAEAAHWAVQRLQHHAGAITASGDRAATVGQTAANG